MNENFMDQNREVVILLYQYSVVVKGIERKLRDSGFQVTVMVDQFDAVEVYKGGSSLLLAYLPGDIMDDPAKLKGLSRVVSAAQENKRDMLIIGEKTHRTGLEQMIPSIEDMVWLDRPVDLETLTDMIRKLTDKKEIRDQKKKILIVDDDPAYAKIVREWIRDRYQVNIVTAGMQAITYLLKNEVDLILLDYEMPVVDGPQVLKMLRQEEATKDIPVVFLTGVGTREEVARVMALKPDGYILKMTTREDLLSYLEKKFS